MKIPNARLKLWAACLTFFMTFHWLAVLNSSPPLLAQTSEPSNSSAKQDHGSPDDATLFTLQPPVVPDSLSQNPSMKILAAPAPAISSETMKCSELLESLGELGLPVVLDQTAIDDVLPEDEPIKLLLENHSLLERLLVSLKAQNATIALDNHIVRVICLDNIDDPEFLTLVSYDVTGIANLERFIESCKVLDPDEEYLNDQYCRSLTVNGRDLLVLNAPLQFHLNLRNFFHAISVHTGRFVDVTGTRPVRYSRLPMTTSTIPLAGQRLLSNRLTSTPIEVPKRETKAGINLSKGNDNFSGMGGGMHRF